MVFFVFLTPVKNPSDHIVHDPKAVPNFVYVCMHAL